MNHKLNLKAAAAYGRLVDDFVPVYMRDDFRKRFEEFLDAYAVDDSQTAAPNNQRTIPKVGEIYEDDCGGHFEVLGVVADSIVVTKNVTVLKKNENLQVGTLEKFNRYFKPKED